MNVMKIVKIGLMASISSNLIHSDWCELCFSDYKEINPPESNLAEEAQKIKESKNKTENNGDENIEKININGTKDRSNTNTFSASKAETERNYTSNGGIIPEGIEMNNKMSNKMYTDNRGNRMYTNNGNNIPTGDTIENLRNNSSDVRTYRAKTSGRKDAKPETEIEGLDCNNCSSSSKDINTNIKTASNIDENPMITNKEVDENNSEEKIDETNSKEGIAENNSGNKEIAASNSNKEVDETNSKVDEDYCRPGTYN